MRKLLHIEPYSPVHEVACRAVLKRVFGEDDQSQRYYRLTPQRTVVAILQDRLIGLASVWNNLNHPEALRSGVVVLPHYRRQGVGSQLWEALLHTGSECRFSRYLAGNVRVFLNFLDRTQTRCGRSLLRIPPGAVGGPESAQPHPCAQGRRYRRQKGSSRASIGLPSDPRPPPIPGQLS
jgi:GNAT superfamily N-acetyltransferase